MSRTYRPPPLSTGYVMLLRHRAINLLMATGKAGDECYDLMHQMLGPREILELVNAWIRAHDDDGAQKRERPPRRKSACSRT